MLLVDTAEPADMVKLLEQVVPVTVMPLNQTSRSDYYFGGEDGKTRQFGRVQAGELLGNIDSMEDELRRYYESADENNQIVEGIISSVPLTKRNRSLESISVKRQSRPKALFTYKVTPSGYLYGEQAWEVSASEYFAWIRGLSRGGVITYYTVNWVETARLLSAIYLNEQKPLESHTTLNRYYRPRISIKSQDPFVKALMSLSLAYQIGIGEEKATALSKQFHSIMDICMADVRELCQCAGIGKTIAYKLLVALGREE